MGIRRRATITLIACTALAVPASARAELQFTAPQQLSPGGVTADTPSVDVDPAGNAVAGWRESSGGKWRTRLAYRTAGGFFGPSVAISPAGIDGSAPRVAIARDGTAIATWNQPQTTGPAGRIDAFAAVRPPGGAFGNPVLLTPGTDSAVAEALELDDRGNAIVMLTTDLGNGDVGKQRAEMIYRPAGGSFSAPTAIYTTIGDPALNQDGQIGGYDIAFDSAGNALIGFAENSYAFNQDRNMSELLSFTRSANGALELPVKRIGGRNTNRGVGALQLGISGARQVATYTRQVGAGTGTTEYVTRAKTGDEWSGFRVLAGDTTDPTKLALTGNLATDAAGNALIAASNIQPPPGSGPNPREFYLPATSRDFSAARPLPAGILGYGADLQDNGAGQRSWTTTANGTTQLWLASRSAGPTPTYGAPRAVSTSNLNTWALSIGPNGHAAILWPSQQGLDTKVQAIFGDEPPPPPVPQTGTATPSPPAPTPTPEPPPPPPPVTNAIDAVGKVEPGRPIVLTVALSGAVSQIEWRVGDRGPFIGNAVERGLRLRVNSTVTVRAKLIGPGGTKEVSRTITPPKAPTDADARRVSSGAPSGASDVVAIGRPETLSGGGSGCTQTTLSFGARTLTGCMRPIDELSQIPAAERGVLDPLASAYKLARSDAPLMNRAVQLLDGFVASGPVTIDGVWPVVPSGGAQVVAYPQAEALTSSNAAIRVAGQLVRPAGSGFNLRLPSVGSIDLGSVPRPASLRYLGGLAYAGNFDVDLNRSGVAEIETNLRFPGFVTRHGVSVQPRLRLFATADRIIGESVPTLGPFDVVDFGPVPMTGLKVQYDPASDEWRGGANACIFGVGCLEFQPPVGGLRFGGAGELVYAKTSLTFGSPGRPIAPGVFLENAGFGFGLNPSRLFGSARIGIGSFIKLDGREVFAFPSAAAPYLLRRDEVGDSFPAELYTKRFTSPLIAAGADVSIDLPVIGAQRLGGGYLLYESPGYVAMGGGASFDVLGIVRYSGSLSGEYNLETQRSNLHGDIRACLIAVDDDLCAASVTHISRGPKLEGGSGACLQLGPVSVGGGVLWAEPQKPKVWPLDGCKWSPFRIDVRARSARRAAADAGAGSQTIKVTRDGPNPVLRLDGSGAAPRVKVTGPQGQTLSSGADGLTYSPDGKIRIVHVNTAEAHATYVGLQDAAPGTWTVEPLADSAPVTQVARATDPPPARISASVSGAVSESERTLRYDIGARPAQRVTFYDVAPSGARLAIGTVGSGKGSLRFAPAPGGRQHRILAVFELDGIVAEERFVARFTPPPPKLPAPRALNARRSGKGLAVSWARVPGASAYELTVTTDGGEQLFKTVKGVRTQLPKIDPTAAGTVTVRATAKLRVGGTSSVPLRARQQPKRTLGSLRPCSVKGKRVSCRR